MNIENLNKAIAVMTRAGKVSMIKWQVIHGEVKETEEELHKCGTAACFAGWIAVSPEWKADGGYVNEFGAPGNYRTLSDQSSSIAAWLDIPEILGYSFTGGDCYDLFGFDSLKDVYMSSMFYNKAWDTVDGNDVISKLEFLRDNGVKTVIKNYLEKLESTLLNKADDNGNRLNKFDVNELSELIEEYQRALQEF